MWKSELRGLNKLVHREDDNAIFFDDVNYIQTPGSKVFPDRIEIFTLRSFEIILSVSVKLLFQPKNVKSGQLWR